MAIIGAQLALGAALGGLQTDAAACFMGVPVSEKLPQSVATEVGCSMQFTGDIPGLLLRLLVAGLEGECLPGVEGRQVSG